jgi:hypothetical protein
MHIIRQSKAICKQCAKVCPPQLICKQSKTDETGIQFKSRECDKIMAVRLHSSCLFLFLMDSQELAVPLFGFSWLNKDNILPVIRLKLIAKYVLVFLPVRSGRLFSAVYM